MSTLIASGAIPYGYVDLFVVFRIEPRVTRGIPECVGVRQRVFAWSINILGREYDDIFKIA